MDGCKEIERRGIDSLADYISITVLKNGLGIDDIRSAFCGAYKDGKIVFDYADEDYDFLDILRKIKNSYPEVVIEGYYYSRI